MHDDLLHARWPLTRGQFDFYWAETTREEPPAERRDLADAASAAWNQVNAAGQETVWVNGRPFFAIRRAPDQSQTGLWIAPPSAILQPIPPGEGLALSAVGSDGRVVFGKRDRAERAAVRAAAESQLPWTLYIASAAGAPSGVSASRRFLLLGTIVMVLFLLAGTYFIARAIRREMEVSRMQSESAAVSRFAPRSSIRHSEMLLADRVPSEDRRQIPRHAGA